MTALELYCLLILAGGIAYWQTGGFRGWRRWLDPVDAPWVVVALLTPLPGLVAVGNVLGAVWLRMRAAGELRGKPRSYLGPWHMLWRMQP